MAFLPLKVGGWAFGEILTSAQMNQLNTDFPFAVDGRAGGSYSLSSGLSISVGSGFSITFNGTIGIASAADGGKVTIVGVGGLEVSNNVVVDGNVTATQGTFTGALSATLGATITGGLLAAEDGAVVNGALTANGRSAFNDRVLSNAGIRQRVVSLGIIGTSQSKSVDDGDVFYIADSTVSSLNFKVLEPTVTTVENGISLWVVVHTTDSIVVQDPSSAALVTLTFQSGSPFACQVTRIGGSWLITQLTVKP